MSVYYEALKSGRIVPGSPTIRGERVLNRGIGRALREVKRWEAEERNALTPYRRTKAFRREIGEIR